MSDKLKRLKVPKMQGIQPCAPELAELLACLKVNDNPKNCAEILTKLNKCVASSKTRAAGHKPTTNFHLQRLGKEMFKGGNQQAASLNRLKLGKPKTGSITSLQTDDDIFQ